MKILLCLLLFPFFLLSSFSAVANEKTTTPISQLAKQPGWQKLVHYYGLNGASEVTSVDFFVAKTGKNEPEAELRASIDLMLAPLREDDNQHFICRFPARTEWIKSHLLPEWRAKLVAPNCTDFKRWLSGEEVDSLSLVFANGYLGNPASFYGHLLLKFNSVNTDALNQISLNFGARIPPNENGLVYIVKGIFGGYDASFSDSKYFTINHEYGDEELRDLWEYPLKLSKAQVRNVVNHTWELLPQSFTYYFASENCAYQMARLLQIEYDKPLIDYELPYQLPVQIFYNIVEDGLVDKSNIAIRMSRQQRYFDKYLQFTDQQQTLVTQVIETSNLQALSASQLPTTKQIQIADTLLDYYDYRLAQDSEDEQIKSDRNKVLLYRLSLPTSQVNWQVSDYIPPHQVQKPSMLRLGWQQTNRGNAASVQLRPTYYDELSLDTGRIADAHLAMLDMQLEVYSDALLIEQIDFVKITSPALSVSGVDGDGGQAWSVAGGIKRSYGACEFCNSFYVAGEIGKGYRLSSNASVVASLGGELHSLRSEQASLIAKPEVKLNWNIGQFWRTQLKYAYVSALDMNEYSEPEWVWRNAFGDHLDWDIRLDYRLSDQEQLSLTYSQYW